METKGGKKVGREKGRDVHVRQERGNNCVM